MLGHRTTSETPIHPYLVLRVLLPRLVVPPSVLLPLLLLLPLPPLPALAEEELCVVPPATGLRLAGRTELGRVDLEESFELKAGFPINMRVKHKKLFFCALCMYTVHGIQCTF